MKEYNFDTREEAINFYIDIILNTIYQEYVNIWAI